MASDIPTTAGRASGIAATARLTEVSSISSQGSPRSRPVVKIIAQITRISTARRLLKRVSRCCRGESSGSVSRSRLAMPPISVSGPVATTTPRPRPRVTRVLRKAMLVRSPGASPASDNGCVFFSTGCDSPVSMDSSTCSCALCSRRRSAGTTAPASRLTMSPGTSPAAGIDRCAPSRRTCAWGAASWRSAAMAFSARYCCTTPITAFNDTMTRMAMASWGSPINPAISAAISRIWIIRSRNWPSSMPPMLRRRPSGRVLGPCFCRRKAASALASPVSAAVSRAPRVSSAVC